MQAFQEAFQQQGNPEGMEHAWSRAIELAPGNSAAWSNRGTTRLQSGDWRGAAADLRHAYELEEQQQLGKVNPLLLNNLGNAEGALGEWEAAMAHYMQAGRDPEVGTIAMANYALAAFEVGQQEAAVREARQLLRRDAQFLDMRCALAAFLWASGKGAAAEEQWEVLQQAQGGLGAAIYSRAGAVERVRHRWPPRATAALSAFISLSSRGSAEGYDLKVREYEFGVDPSRLKKATA